MLPPNKRVVSEMHSEKPDTLASVTNRLESRIERAKRPVSLDIWTLEPKGEAQRHRIDLPSLEAICYTIGPKEQLPFRADDRGPFLYTYVSVDNERKIIVSPDAFRSDDEFWENYIDGQTLAIPIPVIATLDVKYDELKKLLREDESGLRYQLRRLQEQRTHETRRYKIDRRELLRAKESARFDGLLSKDIGIYSQAEYIAQKAKHVKQAAEDYGQEKYSAVLFMDLRKFKRINDSCGHPFGDVVLKEVGRAIKSALRDKDPVYRTGGEEFVAVIHYVSDENVVKSLCDKIKESVDSLRLKNPFYDKDATRLNGGRIFEDEDEFIRLKINVGYSLFDARMPEDLRGWDDKQYAAAFDVVADKADARMYEDKRMSAAPSKDTLAHIHEFVRLDKLKRTG